MSHAQLREYEKTEAKKTAIYKAQAARRNIDSAVGRSFLDSVKVVAKYGAISQALYGIQMAFRDVIVESARFDNSIKKTAAVLGKSQEDGFDLAKQIVEKFGIFSKIFDQ